ncbi:uncharacterized protein YndB with AHSA1/START domain [Aminobacter aminovorans]|uniref:Activator of Hsp90 ATPase homolog 1-like protein n=1 Tax=Aminobacter aminovorans TaxID=83263 RepID=A0A380WMZ6_AMIAI|nr:SRPBCC domain-containing protein [Aminobacter aminovorans]TCS27906.1 uncharacterized protein YndB with AHSA1/START domain [Aminobacter aminovorans]SUU89682.1 Activator of Hsp90 ATPase homolog 1-like protein [Aminobacter aminovorans]
MTDARRQEEIEDTIVVECELAATPEKVWRALTVPEFVASWLDVPAADKVTSDTTGPAYRIIEALPFSRVRYAWNDAMVNEPETFVTFDLEAQPDGGTWFRLTHSVETVRTIASPANSNSPPLMRAAA